MLDVSRTLVYRFAWLMSEGKATRSDAAILKLFTSETYKAVSDMGLQILGGVWLLHGISHAAVFP